MMLLLENVVQVVNVVGRPTIRVRYTFRREVAMRYLTLVLVLAAVGRVVPPVTVMTQRSTPSPLALGDPQHHLFADRFAREPMVVEHPSGVLFVGGYGVITTPTNVETPNLWKSMDNGKTWTLVNVGRADQGALGNSDVDLAMAADGTLYFVSMTYDNNLNEGVNINIGVSDDIGTTWRWTQLSNTRWDDRPWVEVAPDGSAHIVWNDGEGVSYAVSIDRGRTWNERPKIHPEGGSSHLAVGPKGEIAVRITPVSASGFKQHADVELVAVSTDGGRTWHKAGVPGKRTWTFPISPKDPLPRWVEPVAWDATGALYYLWAEAGGVHLAGC